MMGSLLSTSTWYILTKSTCTWVGLAINQLQQCTQPPAAAAASGYVTAVVNMRSLPAYEHAVSCCCCCCLSVTQRAAGCRTGSAA
jgi:hypothetical protein